MSLSIFLFPLFLSSEPYGAPLNLHVIKISHNALGGSWDYPVAKLRNGPITSHEVRYVKSDKNLRSNRNTNNLEDGMQIKRVFNRTVVLSNLEPGAIYEISVRSFTKVGPGPWVHPPELVFTGLGKFLDLLSPFK